MSDKNLLDMKRTLASAPDGILSLDSTVALRQKQARRPPAVAGSNWRRPVILLAENRESVRVASKELLERRTYSDVLVNNVGEILEARCSESHAEKPPQKSSARDPEIEGEK